MIEIRQYVDRRGRDFYEEWFNRLDAFARSRVFSYLERLQHGNFSSVKGVGAGVFEIKLNFGPGYRIYFGKDGDKLVILLAGGTKKRQDDDIAAAQALWQEYKQRKREEL